VRDGQIGLWEEDLQVSSDGAHRGALEGQRPGVPGSNKEQG
jgi:hypothetical protein